MRQAMHQVVSAAASLVSIAATPTVPGLGPLVDGLDMVFAELDRPNCVAVRVPWRPDLCHRLAAREPATVAGVIESVAADSAAFVLTTENGDAVAITVNDTTSYTLNGAEVTRDEALIPTRNATVTHESGVASRVDVVTED